MSHNFENVRNILFIRFGAIGDVVHTTLAYQTLRQNLKNVNIDYITISTIQELINKDIMLRRIIPVSNRSYEGLFRLAQELQSENYDLVVNLQPSMRTWFFNMVLHHKYTLSYKKFKPKKGEHHIHAVKNFYQTIQPLIPNVEMPDKLKLYLDEDVIKWAKHKLKTERITHAIGIVPGVSHTRKGRLWPLESWKEIVDYITNIKGINVIIFGGSEEEKLAEELQKINMNKIRNYCGKLTLAQTAGVISLCNIVIGSDTGPTHIASAVGPKVIGLYGSTHPERTGIYGKGHEIIYAPEGCRFCEKKICPQMNESGKYAPCMEKITVDAVIDKINL